MAVAYVADTDQTPATAASITYSSFAVSGTDPVILVLTAVNKIGGVPVRHVSVSACLSGTPASIIAQSDGSNSTYVSIWAIAAPSGTGTITVTLSGSAAYQSHALLMQGAHQTPACPAVGDRKSVVQ